MILHGKESNIGLAESDIENIRFAVEQQLAVTDAHKDSGLRTWEHPHFSVLDVTRANCTVG